MRLDEMQCCSASPRFCLCFTTSGSFPRRPLSGGWWLGSVLVHHQWPGRTNLYEQTVTGDTRMLASDLRLSCARACYCYCSAFSFTCLCLCIYILLLLLHPLLHLHLHICAPPPGSGETVAVWTPLSRRLVDGILGCGHRRRRSSDLRSHGVCAAVLKRHLMKGSFPPFPSSTSHSLLFTSCQSLTYGR